MDAASQSRAGDLLGDIIVVLITIAQLIFFAYYYRYISWPVTAADGTVTRLSLLSDNYSAWLRLPIVASVIVIVVSFIVMASGSDPIRHAAWMLFSILGLTIAVSALVLVPFDFSVLPNPTAARIVPKVVTGLFVFMALFYSVSAILELRKLLSTLK